MAGSADLQAGQADKMADFNTTTGQLNNKKNVVVKIERKFFCQHFSWKIIETVQLSSFSVKSLPFPLATVILLHFPFS